MPVTTCLSSILSTRFDFGVPLEDVFPPNDIHPRLKYLFGKAHESFIKNGCNIERNLRQEPGTMKERLTLKEKLVFDLDYRITVEEFSTESYLWVIRHFLGLLPLPLMPTYTKGIQFDWKSLADDCKSFLQNCDDDKQNRHLLDYDIAQTINMLPFENVILLNVLIAFLRRLSTKNVRGQQLFNRKSMLFLSKYYCSSIFARPFRPGCYLKSDYHLPLLLYILLRWQKISQHCENIGHPSYFLECDFKNIECYKSFGQRDNCTQTNLLSNAFFNPEVISVCRNIPYFMNIYNNYNRDIACQTDTNLCSDNYPILEENDCSIADLNNKNVDKIVTDGTDKNDNNTAYKLAYIEEELNNLSKNVVVENDNNDENDNTLYETATDFTFRSVKTGEDKDWSNIIEATLETVKKVEESYIYDDYETFQKEDFNQIGKNRSRSFLSKISKYGFTYTPTRNSERQEINKTSTPNNISPESDSSYVKFPDVCEGVNFENYHDQPCNRDKNHKSIDNQIKPENTVSQKYFQDDSPRSVQEDNSKQDLQNGENSKKRKKYVLKRIRLTLEFLRALTPKKSTFKKIESRVKYHKIKNTKSNTI